MHRDSAPSGFFTLILASALSLLQLSCLLTPDEPARVIPEESLSSTLQLTGQVTANPEDSAFPFQFGWSAPEQGRKIYHYEWRLGDSSVETGWRQTERRSVVLGIETDGWDDSREWQKFTVRAVDEHGLIVGEDYLHFNESNLAPRTQITNPIAGSFDFRLNPTFDMDWMVEVPDGSDLAAFEYKLVRVREVFDSDAIVRDSLSLGNNLLFPSLDSMASPEWVRVTADVRTLRVRQLEPAAKLALAVRAVDSNGAIEPIRDRGDNMIVFTVRTFPARPTVVLSEPRLGSHRCTGPQTPWEVTVPVNRELRFEWVGDFSMYEAGPGNSTYALDIPDPTTAGRSIVESYPEGFMDWAEWKPRNGTDQPIVFGPEEEGTTHSLWVRMRDSIDSPDNEQLCEIRIHVVAFTFERFALIVDDAKFFTPTPTDQEHDEFLRDTITRRFYELGDVDHFVFFPPSGPRDEGGQPIPIDLETLGQYQHVFWSFNIGGTNYRLPLWSAEVENRLLSTYSGAGGRLFFGGGWVSSCLVGTRAMGTFFYPKDPPGTPNEAYTEDSFVWQFMKYRDTIVSIPSAGTPQQAEAAGLVGLRSRQPNYPDLVLDTTKRDPYQAGGGRFLGGIHTWEAVATDSNVDGFDSLYSPVTFDTTLCCGPLEAGFDEAIAAHRFESTPADSSEGLQQGRTVVFGFQPWWFEANSLLEAGSAAIDWLVTGRD